MSSLNVSLLEILEKQRVNRFTGSMTVSNAKSSLQVWFVRGNLAHAENSSGDRGWKALEGAKSSVIADIDLSSGDLPPERTIRVDTARLLRAMNVSGERHSRQEMQVPIPLHSRLQQKFNELRHKSSGLKSFESSRRVLGSGEVRGNGIRPECHEERIIIERDPRGAKWVHQKGDKQLAVCSDDSVSTSELMWVGEELWREYLLLNQPAKFNDE